MSCLIQRSKQTGRLEKVMAPNGEESLLYQEILNNLSEDYELGKEVIVAKDAGLIPNYSDPEVGLVLWSQWHSDPAIKERIKGREQFFLDKNGEPTFNSIRDLIGFKDGDDENKRGRRIGIESVIKFLRKQKLIYKEKGKFRLSEEATLPNENWFTKNESGEMPTNEQRIEQILSWFGLPKEVVAFKKTNDITTVQFNASRLPAQGVEKSEDDSNTTTLITFLRDRFPQLKIEYTSEKEARAKFNEREQKLSEKVRGKLDFDKINSFINEGTVYLISGRVNNRVAIEEVLHPFIYTVSKNNPELFNSLKAAAHSEFPELSKDIETNYPSQAGFTDADRELELVTQALGKTFAKEYEEQPPRSMLKLLDKLKEWFAKLVESFGAFVGGRNRVVIDVAKLPSDITLTGIAQLLNTYDSTFLVDTTARGFNFSISGVSEAIEKAGLGFGLDEEELAFLNRILKDANPLQREMILDLYRIHRDVQLDQESHVYTGNNGRVFTAMSMAIGGEFDEEAQERSKMNLLFGNDFDKILQGLVLNKTFDQIKADVTSGIDLDIAEKAYNALRGFVFGLTSRGCIVLPQLRTADFTAGPKERAAAGTMDLLLIRPDGSQTIIDLKTSKYSAFNREYFSIKHARKEGSWLPGENLSKGQTHGIQVGGYGRLMAVNGYYPEEFITFHMHLNIKGTGSAQKVIGFTPEGKMEHSPIANKEYIDKIIPTKLGNDKVRKFKRKLGMLPATVEYDSKEWDEEFRESVDFKNTWEELAVAMEEFRKKGRKRIDRLQLIKNAASFESSKDSVHKLSQVLMIIGQDLSRGQADRAYGAFLNHAKEELTDLLEFLSDTSKEGTEEYVRKVLEAGNYIETYRGLTNAPDWALGNVHQEAMLNGVLGLLNKAKKKVNESLINFVIDTMQENSSREISRDNWQALIKERTDISGADFYLSDIDTSTDPLIAVAAKLYKAKMIEANDKSKKFKEQLTEKGSKVVRLAGKDFSWMIERDENRKLTGRYVQEFGPQFEKLRNEKLAKLKDSEGKIMQYKKVYVGASTKNEEDIAYNKRLMELRKEYREFIQAEIQSEKGVDDGNYYKYNEEYKDDRDKHEVYKPFILDGKFIRGEWVKRPEVGYEEYRAYELKYYNFSEKYDAAYFEDGEFTGELSEGTGSGRFVKSDYIERRLIAGDGTDMRSPQYIKLQNPTNEKEAAMKEFYDFFITEMKETLKMLPLSTEKEMLGKLPRVRGNFVDHIKQGPAFLKASARHVGKWFNVQTIAKESLYNEDGSPMNSLPVFYKGNLRDEEVVEKLKKKLDQLEIDKKEKKIDKATYLKEKHRLREEHRIALSAVSAEELETDLVKSLEAFRSKAETFKAMHDIEASLLAVEEVVRQGKYRRKKVTGGDQTEKGSGGEPRRIKGDKSRALERYKEWLQMTFYNSDDLDMGMGDVIAKRIMGLSSVVNVGIGIFGPLHNYLMARINTGIETMGARFYDRSAGIRATKLFNSDFLPGLLRSDPGSKEDFYKIKRGRSKYEAVVLLFDMVRKQESGEGRPSKLKSMLLYGYKLSEYGEFAAQSKSGIALLMSKKLKKVGEDGKEIDGTEISVYDALVFDEKTGKIGWKEGYGLDDKKRYAYTNEIWEMNKQIHGSYAHEDRMVIQKYTLGQLVVQFHKWVYPMFKARFKARYYDENLGWMEGRYTTLVSFIKYLREAEGNLKEKLYSACKGMDKNQVKNLYRNVAELSYITIAGATYMILKGISEGLDDDDDRLKRWVNFLQWENSRQKQEIKFWIPGVGINDQMEMVKNPFASGTTLTRFSNLLTEAADVAWPFNDSKLYYDRGPYKDQLKLGKKFRDFVPITKDINRWATFDQVSDFFIQ